MITTGGEFVSFYDENRQTIGDNFSGTYSDYGNISIIQDSVYSGNEMKQFIVQTEWAGVIKTDSVEIHQQAGDAIVANTNNNDSLCNGQQVPVELYANDYGGQCTIFFPFEVTYNAEIINGIEYGNLIDPNSNEKVQSFTGLSQWFGYANFSYVADGISTEVLDTIIIRVSTTDPIIPNTDLYLFIKPPPIYVITVPEVLAASDTAEVIVKRRNTDGTLTDFPVGQNFEIAVIEGCVNGNILVDTTLNVYFESAQLPVKFVAADSLSSDSSIVKLRVGTDLSGFMRPITKIMEEEKEQKQSKEEQRLSELRAGFEKKNHEKQHFVTKDKTEEVIKNKQTKESPPLDAPIIEACYNGSYLYNENYWLGDVLVKKDGCENLSTDHSEIGYILSEQPEFLKVPHSDSEEPKLIEIVQVCNDDAHPNQIGGSVPVDYKRFRYDYNTNSFINSWIIIPYKSSDDRVHYYIGNPQSNQATSLIFDFVMGICYLKINPPGYPPKTLIENFSDINDPAKIPSNGYEQAFFDFCGHLCYPTENATYVLAEIISIHEREHMRDFED